MSKSGYGSNDAISNLKNPIIQGLVKFVYPPMPTLNVISKSTKEVIIDHIKKSSTILNIGSGADSGCGRWLWKKSFQKSYVINLDISQSDIISVYGDAHNIPLKDNSVDCIIMQALLEHVSFPSQVLKEAKRVLKPGGVIYIEVPFLQGFHADPHDYQRYTLPGLKVLMSDFEEISSGVSVGPFCSLVWLIRDGLSSCFNNRYLYFTSRFVLAWILSPIRYLDFLSRNSAAAERLANEYFYLGKNSSERFNE